jgi:hypothetical protein
MKNSSDKRKTNKKEISYRCNLCVKKFNAKESMHRHIVKGHAKYEFGEDDFNKEGYCTQCLKTKLCKTIYKYDTRKSTHYMFHAQNKKDKKRTPMHLLCNDFWDQHIDVINPDGSVKKKRKQEEEEEEVEEEEEEEEEEEVEEEVEEEEEEEEEEEVEEEVEEEEEEEEVIHVSTEQRNIHRHRTFIPDEDEDEDEDVVVKQEPNILLDKEQYLYINKRLEEIKAAKENAQTKLFLEMVTSGIVNVNDPDCMSKIEFIRNLIIN